MKKEHKTYPSASGRCSIHSVIWYPDPEKYEKPVAILQIAHGMIDYAERFETMAEYMTDQGYLVVANDHLGHGESVATNEDWGYFTKKDASRVVVEDMHRLTVIMKKKYPELPYFLLGHSMGSFMTRRYMTEYGDELDAVAVFATGNQPKPMVLAGLLVTNLMGLFCGQRHRSKLLDQLMFGAYNKRIKDARTDKDWLSTDPETVDEYRNDPKCSYIFTVNGNHTVLKTLTYLGKKKNIKKIPKDLPIYFACGDEDPVGNYSVGVKKLYERYRDYGLSAEFMCYEGMRHELHNEIDKETVFADLCDWLDRYR